MDNKFPVVDLLFFFQDQQKMYRLELSADKLTIFQVLTELIEDKRS